MCLSFVPPCITTCIANEDKRDDKQSSCLLFFHTFPKIKTNVNEIKRLNKVDFG